MLDALGMVATLKRPRLLVRAARFGVDDYDRAARLPRLLGTATPPGPGAAILRLIEVEAGMEEARTTHRADYAVTRHVDALIALMGEARFLRRSRDDASDIGPPT